MLAAIGARVLEEGVSVGHAPSRFDERGRLTDDEVREQLTLVVESLVREVVPVSELLAETA